MTPMGFIAVLGFHHSLSKSTRKKNKMLNVEIDAEQARPENLDQRSGNKNGRDWSMTSQSIWVYEPNSRFPLKIQFVLQEGQTSYPAGKYQLDLDRGFAQGGYNSIMLDTRKLSLTPSK